jgi:hypothetical protein
MKLIEIRRQYINSDGVDMTIARVKDDNGLITTKHLTKEELDSLEKANTISNDEVILDNAYAKEMLEDFLNEVGESKVESLVSPTVYSNMKTINNDYKKDTLSSSNENTNHMSTITAQKELFKNGELKPKMSLIPQLAIREVARVLTYGETKYERFNFSKEQFLTTYIDASLRHVNEFLMNKNIDNESGLNHLAHAAANLLICLDNFINKNYTDDRNPYYKP